IKIRYCILEMIRMRLLLLLILWAMPLSILVCQGAQPDPKTDWSVEVGAVSDSSAAIAPDGTIYFGSWNDRFWAVRPDGSRKWVFRAGSEIKSSPAVASDGTIYFGCHDRKLYALRPDGTKKWEFSTGAWVDSSPALARDG